MTTTLETQPSPQNLDIDVVSHSSDLSPDEAWQKVYNSDNLTDAVDALQKIPQDDVRWRIASETIIFDRFRDSLSLEEKEVLKNQMVQDAVELAQRRLSYDEISEIGLVPEFKDEEIRDTPSIRDAFLLASVWDTTRDELTGKLLAHMLDHISSYDSEAFSQALRDTIEKDISFKTAFTAIQHKIDKRIDRQSVDTSRREGVKLIDENDPFVKKYGFQLPPTNVFDTAHLDMPDSRHRNDNPTPKHL
ncbi:MAG: hypothetical protein ABJA64_02580 [Candidatus Saccharibacteria bacterium]